MRVVLILFNNPPSLSGEGLNLYHWPVNPPTVADFELPTWHHRLWNWKERKHNQLLGTDMPWKPQPCMCSQMDDRMLTHTQSSVQLFSPEETSILQTREDSLGFVCGKTLSCWHLVAVDGLLRKTPTLFRTSPMDYTRFIISVTSCSSL